MARKRSDTKIRATVAGLLSWVIPGAGHYWLGQRGLAVVFFLAVSLPYWTGLAFGGIVYSVNLTTNPWLVLAEAGTLGYTLPALAVSRALDQQLIQELGFRRVPDPILNQAEYNAYLRAATRRGWMAYYPESDVAQIYLATAGLLNLLVILDAIARAQTGQPTFPREVAAAPPREVRPGSAT